MKIVIVGSKSFDSLEYNLNETFNQQGIRVRLWIFTLLLLVLISGYVHLIH